MGRAKYNPFTGKLDFQPAGPSGRAQLGDMSTHNYSGGVISGFLETTFSYTAGVGYIVTGYNPEPVVVEINYDEGSSITPSSL